MRVDMELPRSEWPIARDVYSIGAAAGTSDERASPAGSVVHPGRSDAAESARRATRRGSQGGRVLLWFVRAAARSGSPVLCRVRDRGAGGCRAERSGVGTAAAAAPIRGSVSTGAGGVRRAVPDAV